MGNWHPIETAPKNEHTDILVICPFNRQYVVCWLDEWWHVDDNKHGPFPLRGAGPTHWMPLPDPPKEETSC